MDDLGETPLFLETTIWGQMISRQILTTNPPQMLPKSLVKNLNLYDLEPGSLPPL